MCKQAFASAYDECMWEICEAAWKFYFWPDIPEYQYWADRQMEY